MRRAILSIVALTLLGMLLTAAPAPAQQCTNIVCHNGLCVFDGTLNVPLGNASLAVNDQCQLVVKNIGSSGLDGVIQPSFVDATVMTTNLASPNFSGSIQGTKAVIIQHGVVDGKFNQEISIMEVVNFDGSNLRISASCQAIGAAGYILEIYAGLTLVLRQTSLDPPVLIMPKEDMPAMECGIEPNGNPFTSIRFKNARPITVQTPAGNPGPFTGDFVLITAFSPARVPTLQTDIENRFTDAGEVTMTSIEVGALPKRCTSNASEVRSGLPLCDFGQAGPGSAAAPLVAVLPTSRNVKIGQDALALAALINPNVGTDTTLADCGIALQNAPFSGQFRFQTTSPSTNALVGLPNTTAPIKPGGVQTFVFSVNASQEVAPTDLSLLFGCANSGPAQTITGVNTFSFAASTASRADVIAMSATTGNDGIVSLSGPTRVGVFSVATVNLGANATVTVTTDTGSTTLPVSVLVCQTDPSTSACLAPPAVSVTTQSNAGTASTFGIFVTGSETVPFNPATNRVFVRFHEKNAAGVLVGGTSVAVRTL